MKKLLVFALFLGAVLLAELFWQEHPVVQGGPVVPAELPATGQVVCKDLAGNFDDCTSCPGQDADPDVHTGCPMVDRFVILPGDNGVEDPRENPAEPGVLIPTVDDTVFDRCTGLEWQRSTADTSGDGKLVTVDTDPGPGLSYVGDVVTWSAALNHCEVILNDAMYAGHTDWRLPNAMELQSIVDYGGVERLPFNGTNHVLIDDAFILGTYPVFANTEAVHWTSTSRPTCLNDEVPPRQVPCRVGMPPDSDIDGLGVVTVGFSGPTGGHPSLAPRIVRNTNPPIDTLFLVRAVRRGTINAAAGGGADGDGAERGGGAGPQACVDDNGNVNGDLARDLSDAISLLAWLFQGGDEPVPFCTTAGPKADDCAVENGNVNGDLARDLSDAISLLAWLFQGGDEPVPICPDLAAPEICTGGFDEDLDGDIDCADADCVLVEPSCDIASDLPATGVTACYDAMTGAVISCAGTGQDGEYQAGGCTVTGMDRFDFDFGAGDMMDVDKFPVDDTITDLCTGLEWQLQPDDVDGDGTRGDGDVIPWCDAVKHCRDLVLTLEDGFKPEQDAIDDGDTILSSDWRYPNAREIFSLMYYGNTVLLPGGNNLIDPLFGTNGNGVQGITSSTVGAGSSAFIALYNGGGMEPAVPLNAGVAVRAVRNAD